MFVLILGFPELFPLVLEHELNFSHVVVIIGWIVYIYVESTSIGVSEAFGDVAVAEFRVNVLVVARVIGISVVHFKLFLSKTLTQHKFIDLLGFSCIDQASNDLFLTSNLF